LTNKQVIVIGIIALCASCFATLLTLYVLYEAEYGWLAIVVFMPLSYGMVRWPFMLMAKLKPEWFNSEWLQRQ
jgi:hypothetical protein